MIKIKLGKKNMREKNEEYASNISQDIDSKYVEIIKIMTFMGEVNQEIVYDLCWKGKKV